MKLEHLLGFASVMCVLDGSSMRTARTDKATYDGGGSSNSRVQHESSSGGARSVHCSSPSGSVEGRIVVEEEGGILTDMTVLSWQIGLGETLCYRFSADDSDLQGVVEVSYRSLKSVYSITDSYQFQLAGAKAECLCDCPGGSSQCSTATDLCAGENNCAKFYSTSSSATGCFFSFLQLSSAVCCAVRVSPVSETKYRAVNLRIPTVIAQFDTKYIDETGQVLDTRTYNVDLNSGSTIDWDVSLQVSSPGPTSLVPPAWYVVPDTPSHHHTLLAGEEVNPLDGWDVDKLGWFKTGLGGEAVAERLDQLMLKFKPEVQNCAAGEYSATFKSGQINQPEVGGRPVQELFPFIQGVRVWRRHVELEHRDSPLLSLSLQHRSRVGVVVQSSPSTIQDFTGYLYQDKFSHFHLNLSLVNASGTLSGLVTGQVASQVFLVRVNSSRQTAYGTNVRLSMTSCTQEQVVVSLHPIGSSDLAVTRKIPCVVESQRSFRSVVRLGHHVDVKQGLGYEPGDWTSWFDPVNLLSSSWSTTRIVTVTGVCLGALLLLILLIKCISTCCCCCSS